MKHILLIILIQTGIFGISQNESNFFKEGICYSSSDSSQFTGELVYEGNPSILDYKSVSYYKEGVRQYSRTFYPDNELESFNSWNGVFSHSINYYKGMKVKSIQERRDGLLHCKSATWYESGAVLEKGKFYKGKKIGDFTSFYETGELLSNVSYDSTGVKLSFKSYYQNGKIYQEGSYYKNGTSKVFKEYNDLGAVILNSYWDEINEKMIIERFDKDVNKIDKSK